MLSLVLVVEPHDHCCWVAHHGQNGQAGLSQSSPRDPTACHHARDAGATKDGHRNTSTPAEMANILKRKAAALQGAGQSGTSQAVTQKMLQQAEAKGWVHLGV